MSNLKERIETLGGRTPDQAVMDEDATLGYYLFLEPDGSCYRVWWSQSPVQGIMHWNTRDGHSCHITTDHESSIVLLIEALEEMENISTMYGNGEDLWQLRNEDLQLGRG